jgi:fibrillarin-like pre-rRNA processing protein
MLKARSSDVAAKPRDVYEDARRELTAASLDIVQVTELDPFERDHAAFLVEKP